MSGFTNTFRGLAIACALCAGAPVLANSDDVGANERLAFSDKLTMYSQRIASSACSFTMEERPFESRGFLAVAGLEIDRILNALENGDRALGIPTREENGDILQLVRQIKSDWDPIHGITKKILAGEKDPSLLRDLDQRTQKFTTDSQRLVTLISNQYTDTSSLQLSDAIRLQVAGRQRMLSQQLSFDACRIQATGDAEALASMVKVSETFEMSANALRKGMPEVGIEATSDPILTAALEGISSRWSELKWALRALDRRAVWDTNTQHRMYLELNELTHEMDKIVVEFTKASNE
jgi:hypothetical protein